jgi:hypothetical protein
LFTGEATFKDSSDVTLDLVGDPDEAGFVQVIQGRGSDPDRARELMGQDSSEWAAFRPDTIGSVAVGHEGGAYTMAVYFTSEAAAREGERKQPPPELQAQMGELAALSVGEPEFFLNQPWLYSHAETSPAVWSTSSWAGSRSAASSTTGDTRPSAWRR